MLNVKCMSYCLLLKKEDEIANYCKNKCSELLLEKIRLGVSDSRFSGKIEAIFL